MEERLDGGCKKGGLSRNLLKDIADG